MWAGRQCWCSRPGGARPSGRRRRVGHGCHAWHSHVRAAEARASGRLAGAWLAARRHMQATTLGALPAPAVVRGRQPHCMRAVQPLLRARDVLLRAPQQNGSETTIEAGGHICGGSLWLRPRDRVRPSRLGGSRGAGSGPGASGHPKPGHRSARETSTCGAARRGTTCTSVVVRGQLAGPAHAQLAASGGGGHAGEDRVVGGEVGEGGWPTQRPRMAGAPGRGRRGTGEV